VTCWVPWDLLIGLMSGTSLDGVDGVLAHFDAAGRPGAGPRPSAVSARCATNCWR
jgi:1,6-anhydro-N-acetylmuramate kinase